MPGFNQKGPNGRGSMTGRKMGCCTNHGSNHKNQNANPSDNNIEDQSQNSEGISYGFGRGRIVIGSVGMGKGFRHRYHGGL